MESWFWLPARLPVGRHQALRTAKGLCVDPIADDRAASLVVPNGLCMAKICKCSTNAFEDQDVTGLDVQMQERTTVHEAEADEELLKKLEQRVPPGRRVLQPVVLEAAGQLVQALGCPLEDQGRPSERAGQNSESSNDVRVLAESPEHGELLSHVQSPSGRPLHGVLQSPAFGQLQGQRLVLERRPKDLSMGPTSDLHQVSKGHSQGPGPGVLEHHRPLTIGLDGLLLSNFHGLLLAGQTSFALSIPERVRLAAIVLVGRPCQGREMLSNVLALLVAPEYSAAWGFARSFGHGVKGPGFALRGLFCDLTAGCKASSQGSLYLRCRGDAGTFSLLDNILRFAWPLYNDMEAYKTIVSKRASLQNRHRKSALCNKNPQKHWKKAETHLKRTSKKLKRTYRPRKGSHHGFGVTLYINYIKAIYNPSVDKAWLERAVFWVG